MFLEYSKSQNLAGSKSFAVTGLGNLFDVWKERNSKQK
jgi:hypothetical protein